MSHTIRKGMVTKMIEAGPCEGKVVTYNRYWMHHDPSWFRRNLNRCFRYANKQYFKKFGELMLVNPPKNRGYYW